MTRAAFSVVASIPIVIGLILTAVFSRSSKELAHRALVVTGVIAGLSAFVAVTFLHD